MAIWKDENGGMHDDMNGMALDLPSWPVGLTLMTAAEVAAACAPSVAEAQTNQSAEIDTAYQAAAQAAVSFTAANGTTKTFQADADSQSTLLTAFTGYNAAGAVPDGFYWKAEDNTLVPFTLADLKGLYQVMLAQGWAAFQKRVELKEEIAAATTVAAVQAIVWA